MIINSNLKSLKKNLRHNFSIAVFILFLKSLIVVKRPNDKRNEIFDIKLKENNLLKEVLKYQFSEQ